MHYRASRRIAPIVTVADEGYVINVQKQTLTGNHGFDVTQVDAMRTIFMGKQPTALSSNPELVSFDQTNNPSSSSRPRLFAWKDLGPVQERRHLSTLVQAHRHRLPASRWHGPNFRPSSHSCLKPRALEPYLTHPPLANKFCLKIYVITPRVIKHVFAPSLVHIYCTFRDSAK